MAKVEFAHMANNPDNSRVRAEIWGDFVGWEGRRIGESGFLVRQLNMHGCRTVLDVALGDGVDTIFLLQQGFDVRANEVDDAFREKAVENLHGRGLNIKPTGLDWRHLSDIYQEGSFDSIICLGNSLTCVMDRQDQVVALQQFHRIVRPGGVLIIDERNYQKVLDNREAALSGELHPLNPGKLLYTGTDKVDVHYIEVSEDAWTIEYFHRASGKKAYYRGHPYKRGAMLEQIKEGGFSDIKQYSDYEESYNQDADFYQYICVK